MSEAYVLKLAEVAGLARDWTDAHGRPQQVSPGALRRVLEAALGIRCETEEQCRENIARLEAMHTSIVPMFTGLAGEPLRLPAVADFAGRAYRIDLEGGGNIEGRFSDDAGSLHLPAICDFGYHRLCVASREITLAIAPVRCFGVADALREAKVHDHEAARAWGLGVQLYSLRQDGDGGIGNFTGLAETARRAAACGAAAIAVSPVHAMFSADVHRFSPYGPSSRLFLNALHIDTSGVLGADAFQAALESLGPDAADRLAALEKAPLIDWPAAASLRLAILRALYERFEEGKIDNSEFDTFRKAGGQALQDHARFEALHAWKLSRGEDAYWANWPPEFRDPRGAGVESFAREHAFEVRFHEFLQWQAARGLSAAQKAACDAGMPIGLVADLAVGADNGGSQAWSRQHEIINGLSVGAPPDVENPRGQAWGLGAFSPFAMRAGGFHAYIEMLRAAFSNAGGVRIDHVLGLNRLWLVPDGESPANGAYLKYPLEDLTRLIALESWRHKSIVIGEDLGTVPEGFDRILERKGMLGIRVLLFQRQGSRFLHPAEWSGHALATTTTHDLPTIAGWWSGKDIEWRAKLDLLDKGQTMDDALGTRNEERKALWSAIVSAGHANRDPGGNPGEHPEKSAPDAVPLDAAISFMSASRAPLAMLPVEDALGLVEQPNLPATVNTHPNWRRRMPGTADEIFKDPAVLRRLEIINRTRSSKRDS